MHLYMIKNVVNGKCYIGIAKDYERRWRDHLRAAKNGKGFALHRAIRKYGTSSFSIEVIGSASDWSELKRMEREAIALRKTIRPHGYNITGGGDGLLGHKHTDETLKKMSASAIRTPEQRMRLSVFHKGKAHSEETKQKLREARARQAPTYGMLGKKASDETRLKMSLAAKGKKKSPETIERMKQAAKRRMQEGKNGAINSQAG